MSGSIYGRGPYGRGRYSATGPVPHLPFLAGTTVKIIGNLTLGGQFAVESGTFIVIDGSILWEKLAIPACMPWPIVGQGACYKAVPNSAGRMFGGGP